MCALPALLAAIVSIVQNRNIAQTEIRSFLPRARKKRLAGIPGVLG